MIISSLNKQSQFINKFETRYTTYVRIEILFFYASLYTSIRFQVFMGLLVCLITFIYAGLKFYEYDDILDAKTVGISLTWCIAIAELVAFVIWSMTEMSQSMVSWEKIKEYIENKEVVKSWDTPSVSEQVAKNASKFPSKDSSWPTKGNLQIKDLRVQYRKGLPFVLDGLTFDIGH
jgi:ABC-type multidrug transport system fused ATPase/permease subunit